MDSSIGKGGNEKERVAYECHRLWFRSPCSHGVSFEIKRVGNGVSSDTEGVSKCCACA
jgi:hypothetical protein